jgi:lipoic acid synthetase
VIREIRRRCPKTSVEVLIPDFKGVWWALDMVLDARPDILNHNIESVPRLYPLVRPQAKYERSLELLARARARGAGILTKSGMMLGVGETLAEVCQSMRDLRAVGCDILTLGQYLRPSRQHLPVVRYVPPEEFAQLREEGLAMGFRHVESGPLVRSSYHADEQAATCASTWREAAAPVCATAWRSTTTSPMTTRSSRWTG